MIHNLYRRAITVKNLSDLFVFLSFFLAPYSKHITWLLPLVQNKKKLKKVLVTLLCLFVSRLPWGRPMTFFGAMGLTVESNRPAIATCSSRDLLFDTNLLDTCKVGCVTKE